MKRVTEAQIRQIIKQELRSVLNEQEGVNLTQIAETIRTALMPVTASMKQNLLSNSREAQQAISDVQSLPFVGSFKALHIDPRTSEQAKLIFTHKNGTTYRVNVAGNMVIIVDDKTNGILYRNQ
jgi:hypothetical protein